MTQKSIKKTIIFKKIYKKINFNIKYYLIRKKCRKKKRNIPNMEKKEGAEMMQKEGKRA